MASARTSLLAIYNPVAQEIDVINTSGTATATSEAAAAFTGTITAGTPDDVLGNLMSAVQHLNEATEILRRVSAVVDSTTQTAIWAITATL